MEEEIRKQYETETGKKWFTVPFTHGEQAFASWGYQLWLEKKVSQVEPEVMLKLADILQILDDEEYTVSVHSNDTIDDKISESIANTAIIDFKKQLKQELLSKFSA